MAKIIWTKPCERAKDFGLKEESSNHSALRKHSTSWYSYSLDFKIEVKGNTLNLQLLL